LIKSGVKVRLKAMALQSNFTEFQEISGFCRDFTNDFFRFDPLLHLRYDGDTQRNAEIQAERLSPEQIVVLEQADEERARALKKDCINPAHPSDDIVGCNHIFHCGAGQNSFCVGYDASFRLCNSLTQPDCVYNLRKGSLTDAWQNFVPGIRNLRSDNLEFQRNCHRCPLVNLCLWCPANAYLECDHLDGRSAYFCQVAQARANAIQTSS
jgi:radical SAM protein with 4Fe4S-binding SPASM domain